MSGTIFHCFCNPRKLINNKIAAHEAALVSYSKNFRRSTDIERLTTKERVESFEECDRNDVCCMLPDLKNKKILDIGFGVGRFTVDLVNGGKSIYATDLLSESYERLRELKKLAKKSKKSININISDIDSVDYKSKKFHLVFTNWLFMYLDDEDCYNFINKSLRWLKKDGYLKFRESCGESINQLGYETINTSFNSLDSQSLAIHRYISIYLRLIEEIRIKDKNGQKWKYDVMICSVIPACIERTYNWKEVQLIAKKVRAVDNDIIPDKQELLYNFSDNWVISQEATDLYVGTTEKFFTDSLFLSQIKKCPMSSVEDPKIMTASIIYQSNTNPYYMRICPFNMPTSDKSFIWVNEENREIFKSFLSIADRKKISTMFFSYSKNKLTPVFNYVAKRKILLNSFLAINFLSDNSMSFLDEFIKNANVGAKIILLESYINDFEKTLKLQKVKCPFVVKCKTDKIHTNVIKEKFSEGIVKCVTSRKWMLITISTDRI